jgi:hypothetical protein
LCKPPSSLRRVHWVDISSADQVTWPWDQKGRGPLFSEEETNELNKFIVGEGYVILRRALLHRATQIREASLNQLRLPEEKSRWSATEPYEVNYLVHGRNSDGHAYYGVSSILHESDRCIMSARIGSNIQTYTSPSRYSLEFTGPFNVKYKRIGGNDLLVGFWDSGGIEELIPSLFTDA